MSPRPLLVPCKHDAPQPLAGGAWLWCACCGAVRRGEPRALWLWPRMREVAFVVTGPSPTPTRRNPTCPTVTPSYDDQEVTTPVASISDPPEW